MKPPILPPRLSEQTDSAKAPQRRLTRGRIIGLIFALLLSLVAAIRADYFTALPLFFVAIILPLMWLERLVNGLRRGVITSRIRTGSRTTMDVGFTWTGKPDIYLRKKTPFRFWMTWLIECALWLFITPFSWVITIGTIIEGGAR